jgi:hypothetical protein
MSTVEVIQPWMVIKLMTIIKSIISHMLNFRMKKISARVKNNTEENENDKIALKISITSNQGVIFKLILIKVKEINNSIIFVLI